MFMANLYQTRTFSKDYTCIFWFISASTAHWICQTCDSFMNLINVSDFRLVKGYFHQYCHDIVGDNVYDSIWIKENTTVVFHTLCCNCMHRICIISLVLSALTWSYFSYFSLLYSVQGNWKKSLRIMKSKYEFHKRQSVFRKFFDLVDFIKSVSIIRRCLFWPRNIYTL